MTDTSLACAAPGPISPAPAFNPISLVAIAGGLWAAASATFLWAGLSWGWALGLAYVASPVLTLGVVALACALADLGAARARCAIDQACSRARTETIAAWDADRAAEQAEARPSDRVA